MISVSWSLINNYLICPFKVMHDLNNVQHPLSWPMAYASCGHKALAAWANDEDYMAVFEQECLLYERRTAHQKNWNGEFLDPGGGAIDKMQIKYLLKKYTEDVVGKPHPDSVEMSLSRDLGNDIILTGRIDAIWPDGKLVDWKFTTSPKWLSPLQMLIYAVLNGGACESCFHALVKARSPYWEPIAVPETEKQENLDAVVKYIVKPIAHAVEQGSFHANPTHNLCSSRYCGYWDSCDAKLL